MSVPSQYLTSLERLPEGIRQRFLKSSEDSKPRGLANTDAQDLAKKIDHTLLRATAQTEDIRRLCQEAREHKLGAVCIAPCHIPLADKELRDSEVKLCTVIGFPLSNQTSASKTFEARNALEMGADELDMVLNLSAFKSQKYDLVFKEIETLKQVCGAKILKCIIETAYLNHEEIVLACAIAKAAGADFVKSSTGFADAGAKADDIRLMRLIVGPGMGVKASGGIKTTAQAVELIEAGASRLGCSASLNILGVEEAATKDKY